LQYHLISGETQLNGTVSILVAEIILILVIQGSVEGLSSHLIENELDCLMHLSFMPFV
jgi:hypothetical protein